MGQLPSIIKSEIIESLRETMTTNPTIPVPTNKYENNSENKKDNSKKDNSKKDNT